MKVRFRIATTASFGGPVQRRMWSDLESPPPLYHAYDGPWPGRDASEAFGRRLETAGTLHSFTFAEARCTLSPTRIVLAGVGDFLDLRYASGAMGTMFTLAGWTLKSVYGHKDIECHAPPLVDLRLSLAEARR